MGARTGALAAVALPAARRLGARPGDPATGEVNVTPSKAAGVRPTEAPKTPAS